MAEMFSDILSGNGSPSVDCSVVSCILLLPAPTVDTDSGKFWRTARGDFLALVGVVSVLGRYCSLGDVVGMYFLDAYFVPFRDCLVRGCLLVVVGLHCCRFAYSGGCIVDWLGVFVR